MITTPKPLFCKSNANNPSEFTWSKFYDNIVGTIQLRPLDLQKDLPIIHDWVNQQYAHDFWQMTGPYSQLYAMYQCMEFNPFAQSFIGYFNGQMICQFDIYNVAVDELKEHISFQPNDCGFHLIMAPLKTKVPGLTPTVIKAFLEYYFSFSEAGAMYAEPDVYNLKSIQLLERTGFSRLKTIIMSYKTAHVYKLNKPTP